MYIRMKKNLHYHSYSLVYSHNNHIRQIRLTNQQPDELENFKKLGEIGLINLSVPISTFPLVIFGQYHLYFENIHRRNFRIPVLIGLRLGAFW